MDNKAEILGCHIDIIDKHQALEKINEMISAKKGGQVITLNAEIAFQAQKDEKLRNLINGADLVTPDGIGVIWGGRQLGYDFPERVTGIDLMVSLCQKAADMGWKVFLFGAAPGVAEAAAQSLSKQFPGLAVVGCRHGYFKDDESREIAREIGVLQPDVLFVALGAPKQEYWIREQREVMKIPLCMGVGGSFDVIAGVKSRAPGWAIRLNLEWLYRLLAEPSRWKRQLALPRYVLAIKKPNGEDKTQPMQLIPMRRGEVIVEEDRIFALDIGTRKILGLVMQRHSSSYRVLASEMIEHRTRAMYDGQIHDVEAVAQTIREVKEKLEERLQIQLESAAVAAAGRALKTARGKVSKQRTNMDEISTQEVRAIEIEAVQQAQYQLAQNEAGGSDNNYICAGYSVVEYRLEGQELASLVGQVGSAMEVEIIATFLPRVVVDSLLSALRKIDLGIFSMTLEPIAALSVAIPPEMRLLNLVLVDIGAGTSDIAVVKENTIFAYAMVPLGGDELTEHIAGRYLLDFNAAEHLKRQLSGQDEVDLVDILGNQTRVASSEVIETLQPVIDELAASIAEQIEALNQKSPDAVICIGGGSLTPGLPGRIAEKLDLPLNRVGIRTPDRFYHIEVPADYLKGPQGVTPLGIAYNSFTSPPVPFIKVRVNEREVALWNIGELSVGTALLNSGIALNNIFGKPGLGKTIMVNGQVRQFKGELGGPPHITVNGREEQLETPIQNGDRIEFRRGQDGKPAIVKMRDLLPFTEMYVTVNGEKMKLKTSVNVDDRPGHDEDEIPDRARVDYRRFNSLADVLAAAGVPDHILTERVYRYYLNGQENLLRWRPLRVTVNGKEGRMDQNVDHQADIQYTITQLRPRLRDILGNSEAWDLNVTVNDKRISLKGKGATIFMNDRVVDLDHEIEEEARIKVDKTKNYAILSDVLGVIDIKRNSRGRLIMRVDGENAGYTTPIFENSVVEFYWKE